MHPRLGSVTLLQLAFPREGNPHFPWKKSHWDNTAVKSKKVKSKVKKKGAALSWFTLFHLTVFTEVPPMKPELAHTTVQGHSFFNVMGQESCEYTHGLLLIMLGEIQKPAQIDALNSV